MKEITSVLLELMFDIVLYLVGGFVGLICICLIVWLLARVVASAVLLTIKEHRNDGTNPNQNQSKQ